MIDNRSISREERLASARLLPLIMSMALPAIVAQFINLLYNIVDKIYIGHIPEIGSDALAGIGITHSVIILISAFSQIVSGGGAPRAAIALGKGDRERAEKILANGVTMLCFFTVACMAVVYTFKEPILYLSGASQSTYGYAVQYLNIYLIGTIFVHITVGLNAFITCQGRSGIAMISVLIGAVMNILLDPLFIFVFDMGVKGAALATVLSQATSAIWILLFLFSGKASLRIKPSLMKPDLKIIASVCSLGIAPFVMASTESFVGFVLNNGLKTYGGDIYISALTVMQSAIQIVGVPLSGFTQGVTPVISYNFGAGNKKRVKNAFLISLAIMCGFNFVMIMSMILMPKVFASIFTSDAELIAVVAKTMPVFLAGMTIFGLQRACQNTFVALGQSVISLFIALLRKVILLIPLAIVLPRFVTPQVNGVFLAEPIADAVCALLCTGIFLLTFKKMLSKCESKQ